MFISLSFVPDWFVTHEMLKTVDGIDYDFDNDFDNDLYDDSMASKKMLELVYVRKRGLKSCGIKRVAVRSLKKHQKLSK